VGGVELKMVHQYITEKEVARITSFSVQTLRNQRFQRKGFPYCKVGRSVRYDLEDITVYMNQRKIEPGDSE